MSDLREDLRSTEESIRHGADQLKALEAGKAALDPADPRVAELSAQAERVTVRLKDQAAAERELAEEIQSGGH